jgi:hypothetical protein
MLLALPVAESAPHSRPGASRRSRLRPDDVFLVVLLVSAFVAEDITLAIKEIVQYVTEGLVILSVVDQHRALDARSAPRHGPPACCRAPSSRRLTIYQVVTHDYKTQFGGLAQRLDVSHPLPKARE